MNYDEIMEEIKSGLTGNPQEDADYLRDQMEAYKDHELSQEIIRACGRLFYEIMPEESKEEIDKIINKEMIDIDSAMDEMHFAAYKKDYNRALEIIESLAKKADEHPFYKDDTVSCYFTFDSFFEEILYAEINKPQKEIRKAEFPFAAIYLNYGSLLFELGRYDEAHEALKKALRWNPVSINVRSEYMETLKAKKDLDSYVKMAKESFKYAYKPKDLARCYRNMGWYYIEKEMYSEAVAVYDNSLRFEPDNKAATSELYYIIQTAPDTKQMNYEDFKEFSAKEGFPTEADMDVLRIAYGLGKEFEKNGVSEGAKFCYSIVYDLTQDEEIQELINNIQDN